MLEKALINLLVILTISHKLHIQVAQTQYSMLQWILGRFSFPQNSFEMRLAKNRIEAAALR